jgi:CRP-like cAMP-binding protein
MEKLFSFLQGISPLSEEFQALLLKYLKIRAVRKKDFLLKAGHVCKDIFYIEKGMFWCYYEAKDQPISSWFLKEEDFIISVQSFFQQLPSYESIQALEDRIVYYISYEHLHDIYKQFPPMRGNMKEHPACSFFRLLFLKSDQFL